MSKFEDRFDRSFMALMARSSGRSVAVLAILLYAGVGLTLPLALHWSVVFLVEANVVGTIFAGFVSLGWLAARVEAGRRRQLVEWTPDLRLLTAEEFEWLVGEVFRREGWKVRETGQQEHSDGNVDLELARGGERVIVQCKRWVSWLISVDEIRQFGGTLMREGLPGNAGIFVTLSDFTERGPKHGRSA